MSKKTKVHVVIQGHQPGVYRDWSYAQKQINGFKGKVNWGCSSIEQAEAEYQAMCAWRCLSPENNKAVLNHDQAREIVSRMLEDAESFIADCLKREEAAVTPEKNVSKKIKLTLTCHFGGKSTDSTITDSNGATDIVPLTLGASAQLKKLELTYAALKSAERSINQGNDLVDIWGVDGFVLSALNDIGPKARERGWLNASGKKALANREVIEPMLVLYEGLKDKVILHAGEQPVDDDAPF